VCNIRAGNASAQVRAFAQSQSLKLANLAPILADRSSLVAG
jgi:hypothetical protein